jgi:hypothetical protein
MTHLNAPVAAAPVNAPCSPASSGIIAGLITEPARHVVVLDTAEDQQI